MTIQDVIDKGYKPGMRIKCAATQIDEGTVAPVNEWRMSIPDGKSIVVGHDDDGDTLFAYDGGTNKWATVITPAPSNGLQEWDSVECGPAMRAAIVELAKDLGVNAYPSLQGYSVLYWNGECLHGTQSTSRQTLTPEEFIARMRVTASMPKPETIDGHKVEYHAGYIFVGCTKVTNDVVRAIHGKLKD